MNCGRCGADLELFGTNQTVGWCPSCGASGRLDRPGVLGLDLQFSDLDDDGLNLMDDEEVL